MQGGAKVIIKKEVIPSSGREEEHEERIRHGRKREEIGRSEVGSVQ
jgi:hypothetical protein